MEESNVLHNKNLFRDVNNYRNAYNKNLNIKNGDNNQNLFFFYEQRDRYNPSIYKYNNIAIMPFSRNLLNQQYLINNQAKINKNQKNQMMNFSHVNSMNYHKNNNNKKQCNQYNKNNQKRKEHIPRYIKGKSNHKTIDIYDDKYHKNENFNLNEAERPFEHVVVFNNPNKNSEFDKFVSVSYIIKDSLDRVLYNLLDLTNLKLCCTQSTIDQIKFSLSKISNIEGNVITLRWKKFYIFSVLCYKSFTTKTSCIFSYKLINASPVNIGNLDVTFKLYYNTCQNRTLLNLEFKFGKGLVLEIFKENTVYKNIDNIFEYFKNIIYNSKEKLNQISSITMDVPKKKVWEYLIDVKRRADESMLPFHQIKLSYYSPNGEKIRELHKNDYIFIVKNECEILAKTIVKEIFINKEYNKVIIETIGNNNKINKSNIIYQILTMEVRDIDEKKTFVFIEHKSKDYVTDEQMKTIQTIKNKMLIDFKGILEKEEEEMERRFEKERIMRNYYDINNTSGNVGSNERNDSNDGNKILKFPFI